MSTLAWPSDLGTATITGRLLYMEGDASDADRDPDVTPVSGGTVTIQPSVPEVRYSGAEGSALFVKRATRGVIDSDGYLCTPTHDGMAGERGIIVPATDSELLQPHDFTYRVEIKTEIGGYTTSFSIAAPAGQVVDLAQAAPVAPSGGTAIVVDPTTATRAEAAATRAEAAATEAEGYAPTFVWDGTALSIDGGDPVDLKGEQGTTAWADLTGKPDTYPPATHTHPITDVDGLQAIIDRLTYDSGWRNIGNLLLNGWRAYAYPIVLRRVGATCEIRAYLDKTDATDDLFLDSIEGFRTGTPTAPVGAAYGSVASTTVAFVQGGDRLRLVRSRMPQNQMMISMIWTTTDPIPATLPGTPA